MTTVFMSDEMMLSDFLLIMDLVADVITQVLIKLSSTSDWNEGLTCMMIQTVNVDFAAICVTVFSFRLLEPRLPLPICKMYVVTRVSGGLPPSIPLSFILSLLFALYPCHAFPFPLLCTLPQVVLHYPLLTCPISPSPNLYYHPSLPLLLSNSLSSSPTLTCLFYLITA